MASYFSAKRVLDSTLEINFHVLLSQPLSDYGWTTLGFMQVKGNSCVILLKLVERWVSLLHDFTEHVNGLWRTGPKSGNSAFLRWRDMTEFPPSLCYLCLSVRQTPNHICWKYPHIWFHTPNHLCWKWNTWSYISKVSKWSVHIKEFCHQYQTAFFIIYDYWCLSHCIY